MDIPHPPIAYVCEFKGYPAIRIYSRPQEAVIVRVGRGAPVAAQELGSAGTGIPGYGFQYSREGKDPVVVIHASNKDRTQARLILWQAGRGGDWSSRPSVLTGACDQTEGSRLAACDRLKMLDNETGDLPGECRR